MLVQRNVFTFNAKLLLWQYQKVVSTQTYVQVQKQEKTRWHLYRFNVQAVCNLVSKFICRAF